MKALAWVRGAADEDDLVLVEVGDLGEQAGDGLVDGLLGPDAEFLDGAHGAIEILQRLVDDFRGHWMRFPVQPPGGVT